MIFEFEHPLLGLYLTSEQNFDYQTYFQLGFSFSFKENIKFKEMEELAMKGFNTGDGYMGLVNGKYILFASESDYYEYMND